MRVLVYTVTNQPNFIEIIERKLQYCLSAIAHFFSVEAKGCILVDGTVSVGCNSIPIYKTAIGASLNESVNNLVVRFADDFDFFFRVDDTDSMIFDFKASYKLKKNELLIIPKCLVGSQHDCVDDEPFIAAWDLLVQQILIGGSCAVDPEKVREIQGKCPNGAGCFIPTWFLKQMPEYPAEVHAGDDLWTFLNWGKRPISSTRNCMYVYEKLTDTDGKAHKIAMRCGLIERFFNGPD